EALGLLAAHLHLHVPLALTLPRVGLRGRDGLAGRIAGAAVHREDLAARVQAAGRLAEARRHRVDPVADELLLLLVIAEQGVALEPPALRVPRARGPDVAAGAHRDDDLAALHLLDRSAGRGRHLHGRLPGADEPGELRALLAVAVALRGGRLRGRLAAGALPRDLHLAFLAVHAARPGLDDRVRVLDHRGHLERPLLAGAAERERLAVGVVVPLVLHGARLVVVDADAAEALAVRVVAEQPQHPV